MRVCAAALLPFALVGCKRAPVVAATTTSTAQLEPLEPVDPNITPAPPLLVPARKLKLVSNGESPTTGAVRCSVVDTATGEVVGRATSENAAAGGIDMECAGFELEGRIITFRNSRGYYAKDARPGKTNDEGMPCAVGAWAQDMSSCLELDTSFFAYTFNDPESDKEDRPLAIRMCDLTKPFMENCTAILDVRRGLNRRPESFHPWSGTYCDEHTAVVVANGELRVYAAPSGKLLARQATPRMTRVTCTDGEVTASGGGTKLRFRLAGSTLEKVD